MSYKSRVTVAMHIHVDFYSVLVLLEELLVSDELAALEGLEAAKVAIVAYLSNVVVTSGQTC